MQKNGDNGNSSDTNAKPEKDNSGKNVSLKKIKSEDAQFCHNCGGKVTETVVACPYYKGNNRVSKLLLIMLALFLGGLGLHKFYVGKHWQGIAYVLFCWTGIPSLVSLFEAIIYIFLTEEQLNKKYSVCSNPMDIVTFAIIIWIITFGSIAAVVVPKYVSYWECAQQLIFSLSNEDTVYLPEAYQEFSDGHYENAYQLFEESLPLRLSSEDSIIPLYMMGQCFYEMGEYDQAIIQYQTIISRFPKKPQAAKALLRQAQAFEKLLDQETATILYKKIILSYGTLPEAEVARKRLSELL